MSFSSGVYTLPGAALSTGDTVSATDHNQVRNDMATAFNLTWLRNGTAAATANIPMGGFKLTGLAAATATNDALSQGNAASITDLTTSGTVTHSGGTANGVAYLNGSKVLTTGSALVFDGSNLGLGVTPSAWGGSYKSIDWAGGAVSAYSNSQFSVWQNAYDSGAGAYKYVNTAAASRYQQVSGQHIWHTAASGTAGNAISFTQAMTLDASGNWILGATATSPSNNNAIWLSPSSSTARFTNTGAAGKEWSIGTSSPGVAGVGDYFSFSRYSGSAWAELGRFDSSGNLLVGTTTSPSGSGNIKAPAIYSNTSGIAANGLVYTDGTLGRSTSALKYKQDVRDLETVDISIFRPVRYKSKCDRDDPTVDYIGFIADEYVESQPELVCFGEDGEVENFAYERMTAILCKALQEQQAIITQLQADVVDLTTQIAALKA